MTTRKSRDRKIIAFLVVAVIVELFLLLAHSGVIQFGSSTSNSDGLRAGVIAKTHNYLRRRSLNSLVWENSNRDEVVNYYDSVLTLKESTAVLKLDNNTEVELSENTLITIDPPEEGHDGEIRLRFVRGNMAARNPFSASKIASDEWTVELKKGSEVELREVGDKGVELQLKSGDAVVNTAEGAQSLAPNQILRVESGDISRMDLRSELRWLNPPPRRLYLHGDAVPLPLEWQGDATSMLIQTLGQPERTVALTKDSKRGVADLAIGQHRLYLRDGAKSSQALDVQVWRAPLLHLLAPLPRNRVELDDAISFVWQRRPEVAKFQLKLSGKKINLNETSAENSFVTRFAIEDDVQWYVEGIDSEGFAIPPLYRYPLYIRNKPFAAPKLKMPELRQPASDPKPGSKSPGPGAWLWNWLMPQAHAEDAAPTKTAATKFEAVFSWEPVEKADQYIIEIADSPDFRNPTINATIAETEFTWRGFGFKKYYWRVAAGSSKGRMGVFTEPVSVDFSPLTRNGALAALDGVLIRKLKTEVAAKAAPVVVAGPSVAPESKALPHSEAKIPYNRRINLTTAQERWTPILLWQPNYNYMHVLGTEQTEANLTGGAGMAFGFEYPWRDYRNALWVFDLAVNHYTFTPDPKERYPFQEDLKWLEFDANATRYTSALGLGLKIRQLLSLQRKDYESVRADTTLWFGPEIAKNYPLSRGEFNIRLSAIFSRDGQAANLQPEWRCRIGERFTTGVGADALWILRAPDASLILRGYVTVGFPF